ncbi:DUF4870 domain-containing protein [Haloarchaeobius sp. TZWSO28]|uniref:DUF4870 domain-containing protein n=1 Tax=Haloarchaeobius sp. TZWSO28 TaxID=3446119 RepID=UPI003EBF8C71
MAADSQQTVDPEYGSGDPTMRTNAGGSGLSPNVAGALAYVFGLLSGIVMLVVDGDDDFVRFHAMQSIGLSVVIFGLYLALGILTVVLSFVPVVGRILGVLTGLLFPLLGFGGFLLWVFMLYQAYQGNRFELPIIGPFAASN